MIVWNNAKECTPVEGEIVLVHVVDPLTNQVHLSNSVWDGRRWIHRVSIFAGWTVKEWSYPS